MIEELLQIFSWLFRFALLLLIIDATLAFLVVYPYLIRRGFTGAVLTSLLFKSGAFLDLYRQQREKEEKSLVIYWIMIATFKLSMATAAVMTLLVITDVVMEVAEDLLSAQVVPAKAADDAFHIACAGVHEVDFLLIWNCRHIANPHNRHRIRKCFDRYQIEMPVICTP